MKNLFSFLKKHIALSLLLVMGITAGAFALSVQAYGLPLSLLSTQSFSSNLPPSLLKAMRQRGIEVQDVSPVEEYSAAPKEQAPTRERRNRYLPFLTQPVYEDQSRTSNNTSSVTFKQVQKPSFEVFQSGNVLENPTELRLKTGEKVEFVFEVPHDKRSKMIHYKVPSFFKDVNVSGSKCKYKRSKIYCKGGGEVRYSAVVSSTVKHNTESKLYTKVKYKQGRKWQYWKHRLVVRVQKDDGVVTPASAVRASFHDVLSETTFKENETRKIMTIALDNNYGGAVEVQRLDFNVLLSSDARFELGLMRNGVVYAPFTEYQYPNYNNPSFPNLIDISFSLPLQSGQMKYVDLYMKFIDGSQDKGDIRIDPDFGVFYKDSGNNPDEYDFHSIANMKQRGNTHHWGYGSNGGGSVLGFTDDEDIPRWSISAFKELLAQAVIRGNEDGSLKPNRILTKADTAKIVTLATGVDLDATGGPHFVDVRAESYYYDYVETMYNNGWISENTVFNPHASLEREYFIDLMAKAFEVERYQITNLLTDFNIDSPVTFAQAVTTIYKTQIFVSSGGGTESPSFVLTSLVPVSNNGIINVKVGETVTFNVDSFGGAKVDAAIFDNSVIDCGDEFAKKVFSCTIVGVGSSDFLVATVGISSNTIKVVVENDVLSSSLTTNPVAVDGKIELTVGDSVHFEYKNPEGLQVMSGNFVGINGNSFFRCARVRSLPVLDMSCTVTQEGEATVVFEGTLVNGKSVKTDPVRVFVKEKRGTSIFVTSPSPTNGQVNVQVGDAIGFSFLPPEGVKIASAGFTGIINNDLIRCDRIRFVSHASRSRRCTAVKTGSFTIGFEGTLEDGTVIDVEPIKVVIGKEHEGSVLEVHKSDGLADSGEKIVAGVDDITVLEFMLDNNDAGDVNVTSISASATGTENAGSNYNDYVSGIFVDGIQQGSTKNFRQSLPDGGGATFNDISVIIPSAGQKEFVLVVDTIESIAPGTIRFDIINIDVDNVENGQPAVVQNLPLQGSIFEVIESGKLHVEPTGSTADNDELISGQTDVEVAQIRFVAEDDDIEIKDIYLLSDPNGDGLIDERERSISERLDFKLVLADGSLVQSRSMVGGKLHFELSNANRIIVKKNTETVVSVLVDVRAIYDESQEGKQLKLVLDAEQETKGFEVVTRATGADVPDTHVKVASPFVGELFTVYSVAQQTGATGQFGSIGQVQGNIEGNESPVLTAPPASPGLIEAPAPNIEVSAPGPVLEWAPAGEASFSDIQVYDPNNPINQAPFVGPIAPDGTR